MARLPAVLLAVLLGAAGVTGAGTGWTRAATGHFVEAFGRFLWTTSNIETAQTLESLLTQIDRLGANYLFLRTCNEAQTPMRLQLSTDMDMPDASIYYWFHRIA